MKPKNLKVVTSLFLCAVLFGIAGIYAVKFTTVNEIRIDDINIDSDAALILNQMTQSSSRNGIKEWDLQAASARLLKNRHQALLNQISVSFFLKNGDKIAATANEGILATDTQDIVFIGNVTLNYLSNQLKTEQLHYEKKSHIIYSEVEVTITNKTSFLKANSLRFDLNRNVLQMKGDVDAQFDNLSFQDQVFF